MVRAFVLVLLVTFPVSAQVVNPANDHTYFLTDDFLTLAHARTVAAAAGGYVVAINDAAEQQWVVDHFMERPDSAIWIGLSDEIEEGVFLWDSGEPLTYENWSGLDPGLPEGQDFVEMKEPVGSWREQPEGWILGLIETPSTIFGVGVAELQCTEVGPTVELLWETHATFDAIEVYRDAQLIATLPGDATTYSDAPSQDPGNYAVVGLDGTTRSLPTACGLEKEKRPFQVRLSDGTTVLGETTTLTIHLDNMSDQFDASLAGWTLAACNDPDVVIPLAVPLGADSQGLNDGDGPEFYALTVYDEGWGFGLVVETVGNGTLAMGENQEVHLVEYQAVASGRAASIEFCETIGSPDIFLAMYTISEAYEPALTNGIITIEGQFIRGDVTGDASLTLLDPLTLLDALFISGVPLPCDDAADVDDDGDLDLADAVNLLEVLYLGGAPPPAPYPECGSDDSLDALTCGSTACDE